MATQIASAELPVIRAAGGIVLRSTPHGEEVMVVYRQRHEDWTLPKGKLREGESFQEAALREVEEETGCRCHLGGYLGTISYAQMGVPKVVMFWRMLPVEEKARSDHDEITEAVWMPLSLAVQRLTHAQEKSLLSRINAARREPPIQQEPAFTEPAPPQLSVVSVPETVQPAPGQTTILNEPILANPAAPQLSLVPDPDSVGSITSGISEGLDAAAESDLSASKSKAPALALRPPRRSRRASREARLLYHEMESFRVDLNFLDHRDEASEKPWVTAAGRSLTNVEQSLERNDLEGGLIALRAARRYAVLGLNQAELAARAQILRDEALKMSSWRGPAIQRLLAAGDDKLTPPRIADAMLLRDEDYSEQQRHARAATWRLRLLLLLCIFGGLATLASFSMTGIFAAYAPLGFFGLLGSALSVAQLVIQGKEDGKIPGSFVLLAITVGAAAAGFLADMLYQYLAHYFRWKHGYEYLVYPLALALGYAGNRTLAHLAGYSRERSVHY